MATKGDPRVRLMLVAWGLTLLVVTVLHLMGPPAESDPAAAGDEAMTGQVTIGYVENQYDGHVEIRFSTVTEDGDAVATIDTDGWLYEPFPLTCERLGYEAVALRMHLQTNDAAGHEDERLIALEPSDCGEGGGTTFNVTATPEGTVRVDKSPVG